MIWLEAASIAIWVTLFYLEKRDGGLLETGPLILLATIPVLSALEIANETLGGGAYYPGPSLFRFPWFDFPVAIVLGGASVVYLIHRSSEKISSYTGKSYTYWLSVFLLTWLSIPIEFVFTNLGFWQYTGWNDYGAEKFFTEIPYLWVYGYHLAYILPSVAFSKSFPRLFSGRENLLTNKG